MGTGKARSNERGAILVEMAFALPLLAIIFLNVIDLGLMVRQYQVLQNAAREGARFSSLEKNKVLYYIFYTNNFGSDARAAEIAKLQGIVQVVANYAAQENITINPGSVSVNGANQLEITGGEIAVNQSYVLPGACGSEITVTYTRPMLLLGAPFLPRSTLTLTGRAVFHNLYGC